MLGKSLFVITLVLTAIIITGCTKSPSAAPTEGATASTSAHNHEAWWCSEHGVPEEICAQCHPKIAADFKAKGDWCKEHDRPDSQCFICHPELQAKFAARYEAKYGQQPPKPTAE
jgi:cobalt-zinc-cadmium efflux system membrane fusion protein